MGVYGQDLKTFLSASSDAPLSSLGASAPMPTRVRISYTNYRGEFGERLIAPVRIYFGATEWHPEPQWLLVAWDVEKGAERHFAIRDIKQWVEERAHEQGGRRSL